MTLIDSVRDRLAGRFQLNLSSMCASGLFSQIASRLISFDIVCVCPWNRIHRSNWVIRIEKFDWHLTSVPATAKRYGDAHSIRPLPIRMNTHSYSNTEFFYSIFLSKKMPFCQLVDALQHSIATTFDFCCAANDGALFFIISGASIFELCFLFGFKNFRWGHFI